MNTGSETADELAYADLNELTAFITKSGRGRFTGPEATATAVQAQESQIKVLNKAIEQQFEIIPNTLTSVSGIGKVYSAGIIAETGDVNRFQSQVSAAKLAGLVWTQHQSGSFEAQDTRF